MTAPAEHAAHSTATQTEAGGGGPSVFIDLDTVLLAIHRGRRGPELGLQADLDEGIDRLAEIAGRIVVLAAPPRADNGHGLETERRIQVLREGLTGKFDQLLIVRCPHGEDGSCACAKPDGGLIDVAREAGARVRGGWYIGADQEGVVVGRHGGLRTIRIGPAGEDHLSNVHRPDYEARDLLDAANHIMLEELAR